MEINLISRRARSILRGPICSWSDIKRRKALFRKPRNAILRSLTFSFCST